MKRRDFLGHSIAIPSIVAANQYLIKGDKSELLDDLPKELCVLFQGDSITDAGRDRGRYYANQAKGMGGGYVYQIVSHLLGRHPKEDLRCFNRGISGHKVVQLQDRWDIDCLSLKPDVLSILIGVNDYWHTIDGRFNSTAESYERDFRKLLQRTKESLPNVKLIICEPFTVAGGTAINERWDDFASYRKLAKELSNEFGGSFVPFHAVFEEALEVAPASYWCPDGVHPSIAGAHLMKNAWLEAFTKLF